MVHQDACEFFLMHSYKAHPLTELTKNIPFTWGSTQQEAFNELINEFMYELTLQHFDRNLPTIIEMDVSNQAIAGILSQYHEKASSAGGSSTGSNLVKILHPVEYHS